MLHSSYQLERGRCSQVCFPDLYCIAVWLEALEFGNLEVTRVGALELTQALIPTFPFVVDPVTLGEFLDLFALELIHLQKASKNRICPK